jgi:hypothetical protein
MATANYTMNEANREVYFFAPQMAYKKGYKYQFTQDMVVQLPFTLDRPIEGPFFEITVGGLLTIFAGYAYDGPSGPTIDTPNWMRGAGTHDVLYQCMRMDLLPQGFRNEADKIMYEIIKHDGMSALRAWYSMKGVRKFADAASHTDSAKQELYAPLFAH